MIPRTPEKINYVADIDNVRELMLIGKADIDFWSGRLAQHGLFVFKKSGNAEVLISATDLKWKGVRFNEFVVSVAVCREKGSDIQAGYYLVQAFNSIRFFALCERLFFSTPYHYGRIKVNEINPSAMELNLNGRLTFKAGMKEHALKSSSGYEEWTGPVFLPGRPGSKKRFFFACIAGETQYYPFSAWEDSLMIKPADNFPAFEWLIQSGFEGTEWRVRSNAVHRKSRTMNTRHI